jgi:signal transduction histidine kinase
MAVGETQLRSTKVEAQLRLEEVRILRALALGQPLAQLMNEVALAVEHCAGYGCGAVHLLDIERGTLQTSFAPSLPFSVIRALEEAPLEPDRTAFEGTLAQLGIPLCCAAEIRSENGTLCGFFALHSDAPPSPFERRMVKFGAELARLPLERERQSAELENRGNALALRLQESSDELNALVSSIAHDLRMPLRGIDGRLCALAEDHGAAFDADALAHVEAARGGARQLARHLDALLALAHVARKPLRRSSVDAQALVRDVFETLAHRRVGRSIELVIQPMPPLFADRGLIESVYEELLANAIQFTRGRAHARIEVGAQLGSRLPIYYVRDDGIGFDMHHEERIFGAFQRLAEDTSEADGPGMGLTIVQRAVRRHGGCIWAEGTPGEGAAFFFEIPAEELPSAAQPAHLQPST